MIYEVRIIESHGVAPREIVFSAPTMAEALEMARAWNPAPRFDNPGWPVYPAWPNYHQPAPWVPPYVVTCGGG